MKWRPSCEGELWLSDQLLIKEDPFMISMKHTDLFAKCIRELRKVEMGKGMTYYYSGILKQGHPVLV